MDSKIVSCELLQVTTLWVETQAPCLDQNLQIATESALRAVVSILIWIRVWMPLPWMLFQILVAPRDEEAEASAKRMKGEHLQRLKPEAIHTDGSFITERKGKGKERKVLPPCTRTRWAFDLLMERAKWLSVEALNPSHFGGSFMLALL